MSAPVVVIRIHFLRSINEYGVSVFVVLTCNLDDNYDLFMGTSLILDGRRELSYKWAWLR